MKTGDTWDFAVDRTRSHLSTTTVSLGGGTYSRTQGFVVTPLGLVSVDQWSPHGDFGESATYFRFVYDGRDYGRRDARVYASKRSLATVAARWAREIAEDNE